MTITSVAAIYAMVKARFDAADLPRITGSPEYDSIDEIVEAIAQIATTIKTKQYGGKYSVLPLIVNVDETSRVTNDDALDCSRAVKPTLQNPRITLSTLPNEEKTLHTEQKFAWGEYDLELAVNRNAVAAIVAKCMDYIGYANKTAHTMIAEMRTHPVVINADKREIRSFFMAPW